MYSLKERKEMVPESMGISHYKVRHWGTEGMENTLYSTIQPGFDYTYPGEDWKVLAIFVIQMNKGKRL